MANKYDPILGEYREEDAGSSGGANGYEFQDYEKTGTYVYVGYEESGGAWYIYRRTLSTNAREYASGGSSYSTNWTSRSSLTYA